jgi:hypothetical protein
MMTALFLLLAPSNSWWLSAADVKQIPSNPDRFQQTRRAIENQYNQTPYFERQELIKMRVRLTGGFELLCWSSLTHSWIGGSGRETSKTIMGNQPTTSDREVLRARMLADCRDLYYTAYKPLALRLMVGAEDDYQLQWAAAKSAFMIGGDPNQGLPYAERALKLRPDDPASWHIMAATYYYRVVYRVGDLQNNAAKYRIWAKKVSDYAKQFPNLEVARADLRVSQAATAIVNDLVKRGGR